MLIRQWGVLVNDIAMIRYGREWSDKLQDVEIERECIRRGGKWKENGKECGNGLFHHYRRMMRFLWPEDDHHRWSDLILQGILTEKVSVIFGAKDSGKSRTVSKFALCDYWCFPDETLILMTSTTSRGLEMRVWGDIKSLFRRAKDRFPWLAGVVVDFQKGIFTDEIGQDTDVRDMRKGIIGIPTLNSDNQFLGSALKEFAGIKQKRRRLVGDELQFISVEYLKVIDAMDKGDFKAIFLGNPIADNGKALDRVSEPKEGWSNQKPITKTATWRNRYQGLTINLVGSDSPNFDEATKNKFPYLPNQKDADSISARPGGKDSVEWWSLFLGIRKAGVVNNRILTVDMITNCGGFKSVIWNVAPTLKIYAIDAGYGGDDCVATYIECGTEVGGMEVMKFVTQEVIPVAVSSTTSAEDQIATYAKQRCLQLGVPDSNVFIEAGMRATLAISFGRIMSPAINAINFGGVATQRPVSNDLFVIDPKTGERKLKTCYEHYSKFVSELAFAVRSVVECRQARSFPIQAAEEFQQRQWEFVHESRYEIESKVDYKERTGGRSPNYSDSTMIAVEGARRLGFNIERMKETKEEGVDYDWFEKEVADHRRNQKKKELNYSA